MIYGGDYWLRDLRTLKRYASLRGSDREVLLGANLPLLVGMGRASPTRKPSFILTVMSKSTIMTTKIKCLEKPLAQQPAHQRERIHTERRR